MPVIECISPVDGSVYAARESLNLAAAQGVASRARKAQKAWARRPLEDRIQLVMKGVARLNEMTDEVVPELAWQMGRPVRYGGEFKGFNERVNYVAGIAGSSLARIVIEHSDQFERGIEREPHGVVFVIAPWNYPYMTAINTVAPALMAGNSVILKHSSQTLLVGERLVRAFDEAGVPEDVFQNVFLDHDVTSALIAARCFDFINFTGSVEGGRSIERAAAGTFTAVGLELGGKDPGYVMEDADLDAAVDTLMDGATYNSGQCCCGIERIYVHRETLRRLRREIGRVGFELQARQSARCGHDARTDGPQAVCHGGADRRSAMRSPREPNAGRSEALPGRRRRGLSCPADPRQCRPLDGFDDRRNLRSDRRHHEGEEATRKRSR